MLRLGCCLPPLSKFLATCLAAVLRSVALCVQLRNILLEWFVTTVLTLRTCPVTSQNFVRIFGNDAEAILCRISALCPGGQAFFSGEQLKEFAHHIHLVKMIYNMKLNNFGKEFASEGVEAACIPQTIFSFIATEKLRLIITGNCNCSRHQRFRRESFFKT